MPLAAESIVFAYGRGPEVLRGVSFRLAPAAVTALVGPNGAGKSTLVRILLGDLRPTSGVARLDGRAVHTLGARERAERIAYVPQRSSLAFPFSVRHVVRFGRHALRRGHDDEAVAAALERVGLGERAGEPFGILSAGQQQRATLARALAQLDDGRLRADEPDPDAPARALLADEPVAAMDPRHAIDSMALLREVAARGVAVLVVLHDLTLALRFADRALVLAADGTIAADGPAEEALDPSRLARVFDVPFARLGGPTAASSALIAGGASGPPENN